MNSLKTFSLFMAWLIITLPIIHAQSLTITQASGSSNVEGFVSSPDVLTIIAEASLPDDTEITPEQIRIKEEGDEESLIFSSCANKGDSFQCEFSQDLFSPSQQPTVFTVQLMDDENKLNPTAAPIKTASVTIKPDVLGAGIESLTASPSVSKDGKFEINFLARDQGITSDSSSCSGIDKVELKTKKGKLLSQQQGNKECSFAATVPLSLTDGDGITEICAHATDALGQSDVNLVKCAKVITDTGPPRVSSVLLFQKGERLKAIKPGIETVVDVFVAFEDASLDKASVRADFSSFTTNPEYSSIFPARFEGTTAIWHDVPTNGMTECVVKITASDETGNTLTNTPATCSTQFDLTGPKVISMKAGLGKGNNTLLAQHSTVTVILSDDIAGLVREDIKLDLSEVNGAHQVEPNLCNEKQSGSMECTWFVTATQSGTATIRVEPTTQDKLGNTLQNTAEETVIIDITPPEIKEVRAKIMDGKTGQEKKGGFAVQDDTLTITAVVSGAATAEGNFTGVGVEESVDASCVRVKEQSECTFTAPIGATADTSDPVVISFFDDVGNRASHQEFVQVFSTLDKEDPNFWRINNVICSPDFIDNSVVEFVNFRVTCAAILKPIGRNQKIINIDLDATECTDKGAVASLTLSNIATGTTTPLLNVVLQTQKYNEPLNFTCPVRITTQVGKGVTKHPEIEDVDVHIGFYENPLGEPGAQLDRKLANAIDDAQGAWAIVGKLKMVMSYLEKICQIKSQINNLLVVMQTSYLVLHTIGSATIELFGAGEAIIAVADVILLIHNLIDSIFNNALFEIVDSMCIFLNCGAASDSDDDATLSAISTAGGGGIGGWCTNLQKYLNNLIPSFGSGGKTSTDGGVSKGEDRDIVGSGSAESIKQRGGGPEHKPEAELSGGEKTELGFLERARARGNQAEKDSPIYAAAKKAERTKAPPTKGLKVDSLSTQAINVKDSIIWSTVCLCLPGIIHNLEKYRQVQCKYATCLGNEVRKKGLPVSFCDEQKGYDECAFIFNQIFNAIPFSQVFSDFGQLLENILTDPTVLVGAVLGIVCYLACPDGTPYIEAVCYACGIIKDITKVADAVISLKTFAEALDTFFEVNDGYCGQMEDIAKEVKQERAARFAPPPTHGEVTADEGLVDLKKKAEESSEESEQSINQLKELKEQQQTKGKPLKQTIEKKTTPSLTTKTPGKTQDQLLDAQTEKQPAPTKTGTSPAPPPKYPSSKTTTPVKYTTAKSQPSPTTSGVNA